MASDQIGGIAVTLTQLNVPPQIAMVAVGAYVHADHNNGVEALMLHDFKNPEARNTPNESVARGACIQELLFQKYIFLTLCNTARKFLVHGKRTTHGIFHLLTRAAKGGVGEAGKAFFLWNIRAFLWWFSLKSDELFVMRLLTTKRAAGQKGNQIAIEAVSDFGFIPNSQHFVSQAIRFFL